jgi:hypothetical protein
MTRSVLAGLVLLIFLGGCAVLTQSQVDEVHAFALAAQEYRPLPQAVINAYGDIRFQREALSTSLTTDPDEYWRGIEAAIRSRQERRALASQTDAALAVLGTYTDALLLLSADRIRGDLDKAALDSGKALDGAVRLYNQKAGAQFSPFGATAAALIRGAAGLSMRARQAELLREYVTRADPMIQKVTEDVDAFVAALAAPGSGDANSLGWERDNYKQMVIGADRMQPGRLPLSTVLTVTEVLVQIDTATALALRIPETSRSLRAAHQRLAERLRSPRTLQEGIAEIRALADEIKAAQAIRSSLK